MHLILGTGPLGRSVMRELVRRGEPVAMVNSSGRADVPDGVTVRKADLMIAGQAAEAMKKARIVYQCSQPSYHRWEGNFAHLQTNIAKGAIAAGARLVVADNLYMYGSVQGAIHEELPYAALTKKGLIRAELARQLLKLHQDGVLQTAIGRGSDFFGPGVRQSAAGDMLFKPIIRGKACSVVGNPDRKHSYTFIDDFGRALVALGEHEDACGQAWHVPTADAVTTKQFAELAYRAAGHEPGKVRTFGRGTLRAVGLFIPAVRETIEMLYQFEEDFVVDTKKFTDRFGIAPTALPQAVGATVKWYQGQRS
ncbi:NAD-dependent epimerase/dehydratase family protein [Paenibacillus kobensis]|uniref:NAD-dependent epimerase/dehydratase family protein n=1 Tax=Paenibacillus kobensis TaxID=59841 RepID=UPI000FDC3B6A|nr:NAD-dependent epimerase/dehydratase family protein [Paenibacillus kobensis]